MQNASYHERVDSENKPPRIFSVSIDGEGEGIDSAIAAVEKLESQEVTSYSLCVHTRGFRLDTRLDSREKAIKIFKALGGK